MLIKILVSLILGMAFSSFYYIYNFESKNKKLVIIKTIILALVIGAFFTTIVLI